MISNFTVKYKVYIAFLFLVTTFISLENLVYAENKIASNLLQMGHQKKHAGDVEGAIKFYKDSLTVDPNYAPAKSSLEGVLHEKSLIEFSKSFPAACRAETSDFDQTLTCAKKHFIIGGKAINPMIIKDLSTWISDGGDQVVAINLLQSQNTNRYFNYRDYKIEKHGKYFSVKLDLPLEDQDSTAFFKYTVEGVTDNGVFVIKTVENGGGSGYFYNLLFVRIREDSGFGNIENEKLALNRKRILIEKLGEIPLGDRTSPDIKVEKNNVRIESKQHLPPYEKSTKTLTISLKSK
jgi:hypothetical protein